MRRLSRRARAWERGSRAAWRPVSTLLLLLAAACALLAAPGAMARPPARPQETLPQLRLAVAVAVTADGEYGDAMAVLASSVRKHYPSAEGPRGVALVAIVTPKVQRLRPMLKEFGWMIKEVDGPGVAYEEIADSKLRLNIRKAGCCGLDELLKLRALQLEEYDRVLVLDGDTIMLGPVDRLFATNATLVYTRDGAGGGVRPPAHGGEYPLQGGVWMVRPSAAVFARVMDGFKHGEFHKNGLGWNDSGSGYWWGGGTIQGLLPWMFRHVFPEGESLEVDRCLYDNMGDEDRCRDMAQEQLRLYHFTVCPKPWSCMLNEGRSSCSVAQHAWWKTRQGIEEARGLTPTPTCNRRGRYSPMMVPENDRALYVKLCNQPQYCEWTKDFQAEE